MQQQSDSTGQVTAGRRVPAPACEAWSWLKAAAGRCCLAQCTWHWASDRWVQSACTRSAERCFGWALLMGRPCSRTCTLHWASERSDAQGRVQPPQAGPAHQQH